MNKIINESILNGMYIFGIELECIYPMDKEFEIFRFFKYHDWNIEDDSSIRVNGSMDYKGKEFTSPKYRLNAESISKIQKIINDAYHVYEIRTNNTCGLHIHFSIDFDNTNFDNVPSNYNNLMNKIYRLIFIHGLINNNIFRSLTKLKFAGDFQEEWHDSEFASVDSLLNMYDDEIKKIFINDDISRNELINTINNIKFNKYTLFNLHEKYCTIEWRGPRGLLDTNKVKENIIILKNNIYDMAKTMTNIYNDSEVILNKFISILFSKKYKRERITQGSVDTNYLDLISKGSNFKISDQDIELKNNILTIKNLKTNSDGDLSTIDNINSISKKISLINIISDNNINQFNISWNKLKIFVKGHIYNCELKTQNGSNIISLDNIEDSTIENVSNDLYIECKNLNNMNLSCQENIHLDVKNIYNLNCRHQGPNSKIFININNNESWLNDINITANEMFIYSTINTNELHIDSDYILSKNYIDIDSSINHIIFDNMRQIKTSSLKCENTILTLKNIRQLLIQHITSNEINFKNNDNTIMNCTIECNALFYDKNTKFNNCLFKGIDEIFDDNIFINCKFEK